MSYAKSNTRMLINCDMGESYGPWSMGADELIMPFIDWANIACGQHASDPDTMQQTIDLARQYDVAIGAHPGYPDRVGFGRRAFPLSGEHLQASLWHQLGALAGQCQAAGLRINHVKPHGALYNKMMQDEETLQCILAALSAYDEHLPLVVQAQQPSANEALQQIADEHGITLKFEAFADRAYLANAQLMPRTQPDAVYDDPTRIAQQARLLMTQQQVQISGGEHLNIAADTLCFHGDNPACLEALKQLKPAH